MRVVEIARQLADGHAVARRQGIEPHEGGEARIGHVALELLASERVRPVQHVDWQRDARGRAHRQRHGPDEGVVAGAHILEIHHEGVEPLERPRLGVEAPPVQAHDGQPGEPVALGADPGVVLRRSREAVLRREEAENLHAAERADNTRRMTQVASDGGLVAEKPDAASAKKRREPGNQNVEARQDGGHGSL